MSFWKWLSHFTLQLTTIMTEIHDQTQPIDACTHIHNYIKGWTSDSTHFRLKYPIVDQNSPLWQSQLCESCQLSTWVKYMMQMISYTPIINVIIPISIFFSLNLISNTMSLFSYSTNVTFVLHVIQIICTNDKSND